MFQNNRKKNDIRMFKNKYKMFKNFIHNIGFSTKNNTIHVYSGGILLTDENNNFIFIDHSDWELNPQRRLNATSGPNNSGQKRIFLFHYFKQ